MTRVYSGSDEILSVYSGSTEIKSIYLGSTQVWNRGIVYVGSASADVSSPNQMQMDISSLSVQAGDIGILAWIRGGTEPTSEPSLDCAEYQTLKLTPGYLRLFAIQFDGTETEINTVDEDTVSYSPVLSVFRQCSYPSAYTGDANNSTGASDPASISVNDTNIVLHVSYRIEGSTDTPPSGYTLGVSNTHAGYAVTTAFKEMLSTGTEDAGVFGNSSSVPWRVYSIILEAD